MNSRTSRNALLIIGILFLLVLAACNLPGNPFKTGTPEIPQLASPQVQTVNTPQPLPVHRIAVRVVDGEGKFYDRQTGEIFIPRGMNYVRLASQTNLDGSETFGHALFDPGKYETGVVRGDLEKMHADGYNLIRVFLSPDTLGALDGLSSAYMHNLVDFLHLAEQNQVYVMFTLDWLPGGKYGEILNADCCSTFALMNANFLPPAGFQANKLFFQDFIRELIRLDAPTGVVFSYELRNEMFYDSDQPPLSFSSGTVATANGKSYDMSSPADRQAMLEENNIFWLDSIRSAILQVDPTALVSVGFFVPQSPNPARMGDPRFVVSAPAIWQSQMDFIDLHAYPGFELNLEQHVENFGVNGMQTKPIIMGEFGGEISRFSSIEQAASTFVDWQVESCNFGFDGWIFWTWDLTEQPDFFNALMQEGAINGVLAPVIRPDPCSP